MTSVLIVINLTSAVLNILYYLATDNALSPVNLFVGGLSLGVSLTLIFCGRH